MSDVAIQVDNLSKRYRIGTRQRPAGRSLREGAAELLNVPLRALGWRVNGQSAAETIWALKDVSFEVKHGEVLGLIGRNGAGKSTLLKILSRITEPTEGHARIRGRVGSLLEVGTGFHPELTGRENIYLNGAILGMKKAEIARKFDEIVAFAEIETFLDTPVKHYSSGMYVRLAFAVAAHLEPEILLVDEVLAVGDASFQKKCLGKMGDVAREGRTVLFVSHNMNAVQRLCPKSVELDGGRLITHGDTADIVRHYLSPGTSTTCPAEWVDVSCANRTDGTRQAHFEVVRYTSLNEAVAFQPYPNGPLEFDLVIVSDSLRSINSMAVFLADEHGKTLLNADTVTHGRIVTLRQGQNLVRLKIERLNLNPGNYRLGLWLYDYLSDTVFDYVEDAGKIQVAAILQQGFGRSIQAGPVTCDFDIVESVGL